MTGRARPPDGSVFVPWSAVVKIVDLSVTTHDEQQWTRPETEEIVYEEGYFANDGQRFRPARCYAVTRPYPALRVLWLEDLTSATRAPFNVEQLAIMARHLGEWSGAHQTIPSLKFALGRDLFAARWAVPSYHSRYDQLALLDPAVLRRWYREVPVQTAFELRALLVAQNERTKSLPHGLAFGDCAVGNVFHRPDETVAIDWATLTVDPIGADAGSLIGSMFGRAGLLEIARNERELFDCYVDGLAASGWRGNRDDVRRGYFCHYGHYLATTVGLMPVVHVNEEWPRNELEYRLGTKWESIPELYGPIYATYPSYVEELRALASRP